MGKSYRKRFAYCIKNHIPADIVRERNNAKAWEYGYNKEFNIIVISKNGTIGDVFLMNDLFIAIPQKPDDKLIRNYNLPAKDQKWRRYLVPNDLSDFGAIFNSKDLSFLEEQAVIDELEIKHSRFIKDDINKIANGDWIFIDGEATYITGGYYYMLQHWYLPSPETYPKYRTIQSDYYYWLQACYADKRSFGSLLLKNRRIFFSTVAGAEAVRVATLNENAFIPVMSTTEDDSKAFIQDNIARNIQYLPKHLMPIIDKKRLGGSLIPFFNSQTMNGRNSNIQAYPTNLKGYDGKRVKYISINDELGKIKRFDINRIWRGYNKMTHVDGSVPVSKAICGGTAGEYDDGGKNYQKFYFDSKIETRNETTQSTETGLYSLFIPSEFGISTYYDEYGHVIYYNPQEPVKNEIGDFVEIGSKSYLDAEELSCKDENDLIFKKINYPRTENDAFLTMKESLMFNREHIDNHRNFILKNKETLEYKAKVFKFNLHWVDGVTDTTVYHEFNPNGKFTATWLPDIDFRNKYKYINNVRYPINNLLGCFGIDPYGVRGTVEGKGSNGAMVGTTSRVALDTNPASVFLCYSYRPESELEFYDDMIKAMVYYSMPSLIERNKNDLSKEIERRGMRGYAMNRPDKPYALLSSEEKAYGGIWSEDKKTIPLQESALESWVQHDLGEDFDITTSKCLIEEVISDLDLYTPNNRGKRDVSVALSLSLMGNFYKLKSDRKTENAIPININYFKSAM